MIPIVFNSTLDNLQRLTNRCAILIKSIGIGIGIIYSNYIHNYNKLKFLKFFFTARHTVLRATVIKRDIPPGRNPAYY